MDLTSAVILIIILLFSAILHEVAHGVIAERLGDPTARLLGRITLNPVPHIDPIMSILLPLMLFVSTGGSFILAAAKPVPVDPYNLRDGRRDLALVSLAGPLTNVLIALAGAGALHLFSYTPYLGAFTVAYSLVFSIVHLNLLLAIFNLLPIPPLDGSKIFSLFLPEKEAAYYLSLSNVGFFIIFFLFLFPIGGFSLGQFIFSLVSFAEHLLGV